MRIILKSWGALADILKADGESQGLVYLENDDCYYTQD